MRELHTRLYVGTAQDYATEVEGRSDWSVLHAADYPFHAATVGVDCLDDIPVDHPERLTARRGQRMSLNLPDALVDFEIPVVMFEHALSFIAERLGTGDRVLVHCSQGLSRSPTVCLLYLCRCGVLLARSAEEAMTLMERLYPLYQPGTLMRGVVSRWFNHATAPRPSV